MADLRKKGWEALNSYELLMFLSDRLHAHGQFGRQRNANRDTVYFPLAREACEIAVAVDANRVVRIEPGPAFDGDKWSKLAGDINKTLLTSTPKIGRDFSFSSHRVLGWWQGPRSGVQILAPPPDAARAPVEMAEHPFILEFPVGSSDDWPITNYRRRLQHRKLTLLLNALLASRISAQSERSSHCWVAINPTQQRQKVVEDLRRPFRWCARFLFKSPSKMWTSEWVQQSFFADLGFAISDALTVPEGPKLEVIEADEYYEKVRGFDGEGLRVPNDLDDSICLYRDLPLKHQEKFDRAAFWLDIASRQWTISASASFAALVSAIEALTEGRGTVHNLICPVCGKATSHEVPGATRRFIDFFDTYAREMALAKQRAEMYALRSGISHGSKLMELDEVIALGLRPRDWTERDLQTDLWGLTNTAIRNWLKAPS